MYVGIPLVTIMATIALWHFDCGKISYHYWPLMERERERGVRENEFFVMALFLQTYAGF